jgi:pantoate--beta-alanine ligase
MSRSPMIVRTVPALRHAVESLRARRPRLPTLGALHDGLVSLIRVAKRRAKAKRVVVNPTQFAPSEDFSSYPRTWKADVAKLAAENVNRESEQRA